MPVETFRTRKNWLMTAVFGIMCLDAAWTLIDHFFLTPRKTISVVLSGIILLLGLPGILFFWRQALSLTDTDLVITSGPMRQRIPVTGIQRIKSVDAVGDSITPSKHSLEIMYGASDSIRVAPIEHDAFITALRARNPAIAVNH